MAKFNKYQLDAYSTVIGAAGSIAVILGQFEYIPTKPANCFGAIAAALVSYLVQRPADKSPDTEQAEDQLQHQGEKYHPPQQPNPYLLGYSQPVTDYPPQPQPPQGTPRATYCEDDSEEESQRIIIPQGYKPQRHKPAPYYLDDEEPTWSDRP